MRVLVTGAGGFLGSAITRQLVQRGDDVRSFSRSSYSALQSLGVEQHRGDLADAVAVRRAVSDCDQVFHVAALPGAWGSYRSFHATNVRGTEHVIDAMPSEIEGRPGVTYSEPR